MSNTVLFSGIQPTGTPHIGNYFGAIQQWKQLQAQHQALISIVDLHALTITPDPTQLREDTLRMAKLLIACGIGTSEQSHIFIQSHIPAHTQLSWIFMSLAPLGELERMTQFKDKAQQHAHNINAGLFTYPVLQAADILLYHTAVVPVGEDQLQHIELARMIARKFNHHYGTYFKEPHAHITEAKRVMSLSDPTKKMSKSAGQLGQIGMLDSAETITKKINRAVTDSSGSTDSGMSEGVTNLFAILAHTGATAQYTELQDAFSAGTLKYATLKQAVATALIKHVTPIQEQYHSITDEHVLAVLEKGATHANTRATQTIDEVYQRIGLLK